MLEEASSTPDPMMDELHDIRRRIQKQLEGLSVQERIQWYHDRAIQFADACDCELVADLTHPRGAYRMEERQEPPSADTSSG